MKKGLIVTIALIGIFVFTGIASASADGDIVTNQKVAIVNPANESNVGINDTEVGVIIYGELGNYYKGVNKLVNKASKTCRVDRMSVIVPIIAGAVLGQNLESSIVINMLNDNKRFRLIKGGDWIE